MGVKQPHANHWHVSKEPFFDTYSEEGSIETGDTPTTVDLTDLFGCSKMRGRIWYLDPGDSLNLHRQAEQEELYIVLQGPGHLRLEDRVIDIPTGGCISVDPETLRQVRNESDDQRHIWLIVGAPPRENDGHPVGIDVE